MRGILTVAIALSLLAGCSANKVSNQAGGSLPEIQPQVSQGTAPISQPIYTSPSGVTVSSPPQQLAQGDNAPLQVIGRDHTFLGMVSNKQYDNQSICNQYGNFGSPYSQTSVWNKYGKYGGAYSDMGAYNPNAQKPPIVIQNGQPVAVLTKNLRLQGAYDPDLFFQNVCGQSANQANQSPDGVVTRAQIEALAQARQTNAEAINAAMNGAAQLYK
jgi:hypothetical protein